MSEKDYTNLYRNLVINTCSENISVYSKTLLLNNFKRQFAIADEKNLPTVKNDKEFYSKLNKFQNTRETIINEFEYTLMNFRSLCSWDGDPENLTLLRPYLSNPFLMSYLFNHLSEQKVVFEPKTNSSYFVEDKNSVQVMCENLICRKVTRAEFREKFARQNGSVSIRKDLEAMYCHSFKNAKSKKELVGKKIQSWIDESSHSVRTMEAMNLSLIHI